MAGAVHQPMLQQRRAATPAARIAAATGLAGLGVHLGASGRVLAVAGMHGGVRVTMKHDGRDRRGRRRCTEALIAHRSGRRSGAACRRVGQT